MRYVYCVYLLFHKCRYLLSFLYYLCVKVAQWPTQVSLHPAQTTLSGSIFIFIFSLKLESWLVRNGIPYENVYTMQFSSKGQIPYVEFNGEEIADSNIVMERLSGVFDVSCDDGLTDYERAVGHTLLTMVENHTSKGGFLWRYGYHNEEFMKKM